MQLLAGLMLLCSSRLSAQIAGDSLQLKVRAKLDGLLAKEKGKFYWPQLKGEVYELKSSRGKQLVEQLSPLVVEALHSSKIERVDSAVFAAFLLERLSGQDAAYRPDSVATTEQKRYWESRERLTPLLYEAYRSTKMELVMSAPKELKLMLATCQCACSCAGCACRSPQVTTKPAVPIDTLQGEEVPAVPPALTPAKPEKAKPKEVKAEKQPKLTIEQRLVRMSDASLVELFRREQIDSLISLKKACNDAWIALPKTKANEAMIDSLRGRYNLASNLVTLWSDAKAIDCVLAGDTLALPTYTMELLKEKDYTAYYYLKSYADGLAEEYLTARVEQYRRMQAVQRGLVQHLVRLDALATAEARQEELQRYEAAYPPEQTAPYLQLDSLRRLYSRADEGTDYLAGILALCRFTPGEGAELALIDALKLLDHKLRKPTERLNAFRTEAYHRQGDDPLLAGHIFAKTFKERYPEATYTPIVRQVMAELEKYNYDRTKFPKDYPSFTSLLAKAVIERTGSPSSKKQ